jgi:hypothetical protein
MKVFDKVEYPRVMVTVSEPFNSIQGAGITMSNLFGGWPSDRLSSIYWISMAPDQNVCDHALHLGRRELDWIVPLNWLRKADVNGDSPGGAADTNGRTNSAAFAAGRSLWRLLARHTGRGDLLKRFKPSPELNDFVTQFRPDLIYCEPTDLITIQLVDHIATLSRAGVVLHVYDDWLPRLRIRGALNKIYERLARRRFEDLVRRAVLRLAIGEAMAKDLSHRYQQPFLSFQNCPEPELWIANGNRRASRNGSFTFRFVGVMYSRGNTRALELFAASVQRLGDLLPVAPIFEIWTNSTSMRRYANGFSGFSRTRFAPVPGDAETVAKLYGTADALVIAYDTPDNEFAWLHSSMPTKLPAYMLSGTPIVAVAPADFAVTQFLLRRQCAFIYEGGIAVEPVAQWLAKISTDHVLQREIALRAREVALKEMVAGVVRPTFQRHLKEAAGVKP